MVILLAQLLGISLSFNVVLFLVAYRLQSDKLTDISYALSFLGLDVIACHDNPKPNLYSLVIFVMVALWAVRIGAFLLIRVHKVGKDQRFDGIRTSFMTFGKFWIGQAVTVWILMAPVALAQHSGSNNISFLALIGLLTWLAGLMVEAIADLQKFRFKRQSGSRKRWIQEGLWKYSRHPNYFGEILVWVAIYLFSFGALSGWERLLGLVSPVLITTLLLFVSGVPILEKSADERWGKLPEYQAYKANTHLLIPLKKSPRKMAKL